MFHLIAYTGALGVAAADTQLGAVADPEFTRRGSTLSYIFTESYNMLAAFYHAASATRARFDVPTLNTLARAQIWPVERSATIPDDPGFLDLRNYPMKLPTNEEIVVQGSNDLGAATENSQLFAWIASDSWNMNIPRGENRQIIRATGAVPGVAQSWSGLGSLTFAENLRSGYYTIVGAQCFDAGTLAMRFVFARPPIINGRRMRPGILTTEAIGNKPLEMQMGGLGVFGTFHSFEPPQIEIFANATAASVQEIRLDVVYRGQNFGGF